MGIVDPVEAERLAPFMPEECPKTNCMFVYNKRYCYPCKVITHYIEEQTKTSKTRLIINKIQLNNPNLTIEDINVLATEENKKYANLLYEEVALMFVAHNLGVTIKETV